MHLLSRIDVKNTKIFNHFSLDISPLVYSIIKITIPTIIKKLPMIFFKVILSFKKNALSIKTKKYVEAASACDIFKGIKRNAYVFINTVTARRKYALIT